MNGGGTGGGGPAGESLPEEVGGVDDAGGGVNDGGSGISMGFASGEAEAGAGSLLDSGSTRPPSGSVNFTGSGGFTSFGGSGGFGASGIVVCKSSPSGWELKSVRALGSPVLGPLLIASRMAFRALDGSGGANGVLIGVGMSVVLAALLSSSELSVGSGKLIGLTTCGGAEIDALCVRIVGWVTFCSDSGSIAGSSASGRLLAVNVPPSVGGVKTNLDGSGGAPDGRSSDSGVEAPASPADILGSPKKIPLLFFYFEFV